MNILEALSAVTSGRKVRRPNWLPGDYIGRSNQGTICMMGAGNWGKLMLMNVENILATDWHIVEEESK